MQQDSLCEEWCCAAPLFESQRRLHNVSFPIGHDRTVQIELKSFWQPEAWKHDRETKRSNTKHRETSAMTFLCHVIDHSSLWFLHCLDNDRHFQANIQFGHGTWKPRKPWSLMAPWMKGRCWRMWSCPNTSPVPPLGTETFGFRCFFSVTNVWQYKIRQWSY